MNIRLIRENKGMHIRDLAKVVGISVPYLSAIERGKINDEKIMEKIAMALDIDINVLRQNEKLVEKLQQLAANTTCSNEAYIAREKIRLIKAKYGIVENNGLIQSFYV